VGESLGVEVVKAKQHLLEVVSADFLRECASVCHIVEELTTEHRLLSDVSHWNLFSALLVPGGLFLEFVVFDDIVVVEFLGGFDLLLE